MLAQILITIGIIINGLGTASYVVATVKGKVKPNKVTFFAWSLAPFVAFLAQVAQGVGVQSLMTLSVSIFPISIFVASFINKKAYWKLQLGDLLCGVLSVAGLVLWYFTKEPNIALILSIVSEGLATLPTVIKAYHHPNTEKSWPWVASLVSGVLTLVTITQWNFQTVGFPLFYSIEMVIIFALVQFRIGKR